MTSQCQHLCPKLSKVLFVAIISPWSVPTRRRMEGAFLARCFAAEGLADQFRVAANGITRYGLDTQSIKCAIFPVPPLPEQRAIAAFLDRRRPASTH